MSHYQKHIFVCTNQKAPGKKCCATNNAEDAFQQLKTMLLELELFGPNQTRVSKSGCLGRCSLGPCIVIYPEGVWYSYKTPEDLSEIVHSHIVDGKLVDRLLLEA